MVENDYYHIYVKDKISFKKEISPITTGHVYDNAIAAICFVK